MAAHETLQRALVPPSEVLGTLDWADTRIAGRLLDLAVEVERRRAG